MLRRAQAAEEWLKLCWIRPEDIPLYNQAGIHYFKLQGRHTVQKGDPVRAVECYFAQRYDGNLIDLLELFGCPYEFKPALDNRSLDGFLIPPLSTNPAFAAATAAAAATAPASPAAACPSREPGGCCPMAREFYEEFDPFSALLKECKKEDMA